LKDRILYFIEEWSEKLHTWAFYKRYKQLKKRARDPNEWIKGYKEWKKRYEKKF